MIKVYMRNYAYLCRPGKPISRLGGESKGGSGVVPVPSKPEIRRPKAERNPKSEAPNPQRPRPSSQPSGQAILGFRISAFFRVSDFGLRISGLPALFSLQLAVLQSSPVGTYFGSLSNRNVQQPSSSTFLLAASWFFRRGTTA